MAREKIDNKLNVVIGTKAQVEADNTIPENSIIVVTDEELTASDITQDANNRFVTDAEKSTWNGKQNALTAGDGISIVSDVISASGGITGEVWDTATKALTLSDANKLILCTYTSDQTLTVSPDSNAPFPIGTMITFSLIGPSKVTFVVVAGTGVTLNSSDSLVTLATQYAMASLIKLAPNHWQLVGALE